ncbi:cytochrome bo3 quinol oxidase subunit 2 [Paucimonas lemoignei]|uniref:Ubiquinol oxidase subunit 2 n=1 Tax=Paucimonas lemoignei TaxID=29443 RepID=A0A4R3I1M5_PAULE|nr:ubiquinol oxidase subunit II [Paucimonas lemoignei]TCS39442.1 cytochrome bo3 quinol oxidase subunit 2 [Paucimonas lemoignei]
MKLSTLRRGILLLLVGLLAGCDMVVLNPSGDIAAQQGKLVIVATALMLLIIVPVIALTVIFAWRYRKNNTSAKYDPDWDHSTKLEFVIWGGPLLIIIVLGLITWISTHKLDPYRPLDRIDASRAIPADVKPLEVQVVSLDWKWLFIYPEQGVATVNELVTPIDVPVRFKLTSSTVMNAFYIPELAGMIYTMPGMETQLNAVMNKHGVYDGFSSNYSGSGFSQMRFKYHGVSHADFDAWVEKTRAGGGTLDRAVYTELEKPTTAEPVRRYGAVSPGLYDAILNRCVAPDAVCLDKLMADDANRVRAALAKKAGQLGEEPQQEKENASTSHSHHE